MRTFAKDVVFADASGRYNELAMHFFPCLARAVANPGRHVPDPFKDHQGKDGFRVMPDFNQTGKMVCNSNTLISEPGKPFGFFKLMMKMENISFDAALEKVGTYLGSVRTGVIRKGSGDAAPLTAEQKAAAAAARKKAEAMEAKARAEHAVSLKKASEAISRQLEHCVSLYSGQADEVWQYFSSRGLGMLKSAPESLFSNVAYSPRTPYYDGNRLIGYYGAIVSKITTGDGKLWSLHRTFLFNGAKAPVSCPKKVMTPQLDAEGQCRIIRLGDVPSHGVLGIAEGIETALSAHVGMRIPVWACVSASFMPQFVPPEGVHTVLIFADADLNGAGQTAARKLCGKLKAQGLNAFIVMPKSGIPEGSKGIDWNDELRAKGVFAFPDPFNTMTFIMNRRAKAQQA